MFKILEHLQYPLYKSDLMDKIIRTCFIVTTLIRPKYFLPIKCFLLYTLIPSHELPGIDKYFDLWLKSTPFVKILTECHNP